MAIFCPHFKILSYLFYIVYLFSLASGWEENGPPIKGIGLLYETALDLTLGSHTIRARAGRGDWNNYGVVNEAVHFPY